MTQRFRHLHALVICVLGITLFATSCKKSTPDQPAPVELLTGKANGKHLRAGKAGGTSFKEFIFQEGLLDYSKLTKQESGPTSRTLIRYFAPGDAKLFKYMLVETIDAHQWTTMYLVSAKPSLSNIELYSIEMREGAVIHYDKLLQGQDPLINGVQVDKVNYDIDDALSSVPGKVVPDCGTSSEYCLDSWLVTYGTETGTVYTIEYSPVCYTVPCGGGGGGNPANPPLACNPNAVWPEEIEFNNYVQSVSTPVSFTAPVSPQQSDPITDAFTWTVVKGLFNIWRVEAVTTYSYTHDLVYNLANNSVKHIYNFLEYRTGEPYYIGPNMLVGSTYVHNTTLDRIVDNNSSNAHGKTKVFGIIKHLMEVPERVPYCGGLKAEKEDNVTGQMTFTPR